MKPDRRAPVVRLLTASEAADRLELSLEGLDRLVQAGTLAVLRVSARGGRRFWPADVELVAGGQKGNPVAVVVAAAIRPDPSESLSPTARRTAPPLGRRRAIPTLRGTPEGPRWPRYAFAPERVRTAYLAFRDSEHVAGYLQARKGLPAGS